MKNKLENMTTTFWGITTGISILSELDMTPIQFLNDHGSNLLVSLVGIPILFFNHPTLRHTFFSELPEKIRPKSLETQKFVSAAVTICSIISAMIINLSQEISLSETPRLIAETFHNFTNYHSVFPDIGMGMIGTGVVTILGLGLRWNKHNSIASD